MNDFEIDSDVRDLDDRLKALSHQVPIDAAHKHLLRARLLRRHAELLTDSSRGGLLSRFRKMKRLALVTPAALSTVAIAAVVVAALQISGQQHPQPADAQRLSEPAVIKTVPTITGWSATVTRYRSNSTDSTVQVIYLSKNIWAYISKYNGKPFPVLYVSGQPKKVPAAWQWMFVQLPAALVDKRFQILHARRMIAGTSALGVRFALAPSAQTKRVDGTAWVDVSTGRILALERQVFSKGRLIEEDWARYHYRGASK